jgi:RHS repeat-associated protein
MISSRLRAHKYLLHITTYGTIPPLPFSSTTRVITYTYDHLYRLTSADYSTGETFAYGYDAVGNRTVQTQTITSTTVTTYTYDDANRLDYYYEDGDQTDLAWDDNGNLLTQGTSVYTWDAANRLVSAEVGGVVSTFAYNGLGQRTSQTVAGVTTEYVLDVATGLPEVIVATTGGSSTYYMQVSGQILAQYGSGAWAYALPDHLGSVRQFTNAGGQVTLAQSYDPFGNLFEATGSGASEFGYTGEQVDAGTELLFLRARYYDPGVGRFLSRDPWLGNTQRPQTLHRFAYVLNNAINYTDPSGRISKDLIVESLEGTPMDWTFGDFDRWGLYALLRDAEFGDSFVARTLDFDETPDDRWPLAPDPRGRWSIVRSGCPELSFFNPGHGQISLIELFRAWLIPLQENIPVEWWRERTTKYHWYELENGRFYRDFTDTEAPDMLVKGLSASKGIETVAEISGELPTIGVGVGAYEIEDRFGRIYHSVSVNLGLDVSLPGEHWEGYAGPPGVFDTKVDGGLLRDIIEGPSARGSLQLYIGGAAEAWREGWIALFGTDAAVGIVVSPLGWTWYVADSGRKWDWIESIPGYESLESYESSHN